MVLKYKRTNKNFYKKGKRTLKGGSFIRGLFKSSKSKKPPRPPSQPPLLPPPRLPPPRLPSIHRLNMIAARKYLNKQQQQQHSNNNISSRLPPTKFGILQRQTQNSNLYKRPQHTFSNNEISQQKKYTDNLTQKHAEGTKLIKAAITKTLQNNKKYNKLETNQQVNKEELYKNQLMIDRRNIYNTLQGFTQKNLPKENIYSILKRTDEHTSDKKPLYEDMSTTRNPKLPEVISPNRLNEIQQSQFQLLDEGPYVDMSHSTKYIQNQTIAPAPAPVTTQVKTFMSSPNNMTADNAQFFGRRNLPEYSKRRNLEDLNQTIA